MVAVCLLDHDHQGHKKAVRRTLTIGAARIEFPGGGFGGPWSCPDTDRFARPGWQCLHSVPLLAGRIGRPIFACQRAAKASPRARRLGVAFAGKVQQSEWFVGSRPGSGWLLSFHHREAVRRVGRFARGLIQIELIRHGIDHRSRRVVSAFP